MGISALGTAEGEDREGEEIEIGTHGGVDGCVFEEGVEVAFVDRDALEDGGSSCLLDVVANLLEFVHRRLLLVSLMIIILKVF